MRHSHAIVSAGALMVLAGTACAQNNGDIIFTDETLDAVRMISGGTVSTLYQFNTDVRLAGIDRVGSDFYVASGFPADPTDSYIFKISDLFGAPTSSILDAGYPIQNPIGLKYDPFTNGLLTVNNPGYDPNIDPRFEGILSTTLGGVTSVVFVEPPLSDPNPKYRAGADLTPDPFSNDFFVTSNNGGVDDPGGFIDSEASTLWRLNPTSGSMDLVADLSNTAWGTLSHVRGITTLPDGDIVFTDRNSGGIFRMAPDGTGLSLIAMATTPGRIEYNPYTGALVFGEADLDQISQINVDGTGYTVLATGVEPRGLYIIPAPSAIALLGLGGLAAIRRRR